MPRHAICAAWLATFALAACRSTGDAGGPNAPAAAADPGIGYTGPTGNAA